MRYYMKGVCAEVLDLQIEDDVITGIQVYGGCDGNRQGIAALALGQNAKDVAKKLSGIRCGMKSTSCPDQIAKAINQYYENH
ncbi:MAG: TIGR03905 family TSCPD domain-containing protein [Bacillota bacterium]|jgi:uncharacterized protein (TIGR03905 family)